MMETTFVVNIRDLNQHGQGVATLPDGLCVFVDDAFPGEQVRITLIERKSSYAVGHVMERLVVSPDRVDPSCELASRCGGCQFQGMAYEAQLVYKAERLRRCLKKLAKLDDTQLDSLIPAGTKAIASPSPSRYRSKSQMPISMGSEGIQIGFYERKSHRLVDGTSCPIQSELADVLRRVLRSCLERFSFPLSSPTQKEGLSLFRHLLVRVSEAEQTVLATLVLSLSKEDWKAGHYPKPLLSFLDTFAQEAAEALSKKGASLAQLYLNFHPKPSNLISTYDFLPYWGSRKHVMEVVQGLRYELGPASFFQINVPQTERLYQRALDLAGLSGKEVVYDLYCGAGSISLLLAKHAKQVIGVEVVEEAVINARQAALRNYLINVDFYLGKAELVLPDLLDRGLIPRAEVVVVDPPRKGLELSLIECIAELSPHRLVYVSCDPATLSRDVGIFREKGYELTVAEAFDMFPQTSHVECVVLMERRYNVVHERLT